jgi:hypothetical protein
MTSPKTWACQCRRFIGGFQPQNDLNERIPLAYYFFRILRSPLIATPGMESLPDAAQFTAPAERPEANVTTQETPDGRTFMLMAAWSETGPPDTARLSIQIALDISQEAALLTIYQRKLAWALSLVTVKK